MMEQDAAPAGEGPRIPPRSGGAGAPPAGTTTRCEELADEERLGRPLSNQRHAIEPSSEARPGAVKDAAMERRGACTSRQRCPRRRPPKPARAKADAERGSDGCATRRSIPSARMSGLPDMRNKK